MSQANWRLITGDPWVLETIMGYKIEFHSVPCPVPWSRIFMSTAQLEAIQGEIDKMALQGAIHSVFLKHRKEGGRGGGCQQYNTGRQEGRLPPPSYKPAINSFVNFQHFQMEGIHMLRELLKKGDFMVKLDLKDAYVTVPVFKGAPKILKVRLEGNSMKVCMAPRTFTRIMKPVVAKLWNLGIRLIIYLDDLLILADSEQTARLRLATAMNVLESLGFVINLKKSVLSSGQKI